MRIVMTTALFAAAIATTPALAQNRAPFTGARVEGLIGYDRLNAGDNAGDKSDGVLYGVGAGYDFQAGRAVLGVEGELTDSSTRTNGQDVLSVGDRISLRTGRDIYAGVRAGALVSPATLIYAKGGYTNARFKIGYTDPAAGAVDYGFTTDGYRLGAGVEHALSPNAFVKAEYRYSNYSRANFNGTKLDIDTDRHQGVVGVGVRF